MSCLSNNNKHCEKKEKLGDDGVQCVLRSYDVTEKLIAEVFLNISFSFSLHVAHKVLVSIDDNTCVK